MIFTFYLPFGMRNLYFLWLALALLVPNFSFSAFEIKGTIRETQKGPAIAGAILTLDGENVLATTTQDGEFLIWFKHDSVCGRKIHVHHPLYPSTYFFIPWLKEIPDSNGRPSQTISYQANIEMGDKIAPWVLNKFSNPWSHSQRDRYKKTDSITVSIQFCPSGYLPSLSEIALAGSPLSPTLDSNQRFTATVPLSDVHLAKWLIVSTHRTKVEIPLSQTLPFRDITLKLAPDSVPQPFDFEHFSYPAQPENWVEPVEVTEPLPAYFENINRQKLAEIQEQFNQSFKKELPKSKYSYPQSITLSLNLDLAEEEAIQIYSADGNLLEDASVLTAAQAAWKSVALSTPIIHPNKRFLIFMDLDRKRGLFIEN